MGRGWQRALQRAPRDEEAKTMRALLDHHLDTYRRDPEAAAELLETGLAPAPDSLDKPELAAWTQVCRVILNLNETITRN